MRNLHTNQRDGSFGLFSMRWYIGTCVETCRRHVLRCDVICALAYCGRHESSHIVKAHADLALWEFLGSHRFNEIQQDDYLWEFVVVCGLALKPQISRITRIFFLLNPCDYSCWILLNLCEGFLFVEGEWRVIFCVNGVGDFDVPWFFCIFVIIKLSQAWMRLY